AAAARAPRDRRKFRWESSFAAPFGWQCGNVLFREADPPVQRTAVTEVRVDANVALVAPAVHFHDPRARARNRAGALLLAPPEQVAARTRGAEHVIAQHEAHTPEHGFLLHALAPQGRAHSLGVLHNGRRVQV